MKTDEVRVSIKDVLEETLPGLEPTVFYGRVPTLAFSRLAYWVNIEGTPVYIGDSPEDIESAMSHPSNRRRRYFVFMLKTAWRQANK